MYVTGDFIESGQKFNTDLCGPRTERFMDFISTDLGEKQWNSIFIALWSLSKQTAKQQAMDHAVPNVPHERTALPLSDPPSPPRDE
jgi:hypothetical protein